MGIIHQHRKPTRRQLSAHDPVVGADVPRVDEVVVGLEIHEQAAAGPEDARGRFLTALGFKLPDGLVEITGKEFGGNLSMERADLLDVDVIVWLDAKDAKGPLGGPLYSSLTVHTQAREVHLDSYNDPLGGATSFVSVLSLPFLLGGLVPQLATAVDGDPATKVTPAAP
jgi:iron complex transport system substrate-binding protein